MTDFQHVSGLIDRCRSAESSDDPVVAAKIAEREARDEERRARDQRDRRDTLRKRSLVPPRFAGVELGAIPRSGDNAKALDAARTVVSQRFSVSIALFGRTVGSGKTTIGAGIVNAAIELLVPAKMLTVVTLVDQLHEASKYGSDEDVNEIVADFARTPVLLLDDLGREPVTRRTLSWLYELLNRRWNACRPLIITTNLPFEDLLGRYSDACVRANEPESTADAIVDRLRGLVPLESWVEVRGGSRR